MGFEGLPLRTVNPYGSFPETETTWLSGFPGIVSAVAGLRCRTAILDGEIVCLDSEGQPCFEDLQNAKPTNQKALFFYCFDLMHLNGRNFCSEPLLERKERLKELLSGSASDLRFSDALEADPDELANFCRENRLEGIVAKKCHSRYEPGKRSGAWTKFKTYQTGKFVVGGFRLSDSDFSSLAVGFRRVNNLGLPAKLNVTGTRSRSSPFANSSLEKSSLSARLNRSQSGNKAIPRARA